MRVVILLDRAFARREREMLSRLEIGLADEGVRVVHAVPFASLGEENVGLYSTVVGYHDRGFGFTRRFRAGMLREGVCRALDEGDDATVDVIHAFGMGTWRLAIDLASMMGSAVLLELWQAAAINAAANATSLKFGKRSAEFAVCEPGMRRALRKRVPHATVHVTPWGVHTPAHLPALKPREVNRPLAVALLSDRGDPTAVAAALTGIAELGNVSGVGGAGGGGGVLVFAGTQDGAAGRDSTIWSAARRLGLLDRLSLVSDMEARREPVLDMDLLVLPEATGRHRTVVLDAMARGVTVVGAMDELNEALVEDSRAVLVRRPTPEAWTAALLDAVTNIERTNARRTAAYEFVKSEKRASGHAATVLTAYNAMVTAAKVGVPDLARSLS